MEFLEIFGEQKLPKFPPCDIIVVFREICARNYQKIHGVWGLGFGVSQQAAYREMQRRLGGGLFGFIEPEPVRDGNNPPAQ